MSPPAWAYQYDIFDPPPDEELVCSICRGIFCDPVRSACNHVFCRNCIYKWLENNRNCPICRKRTSRYNIEEVVPLIKNMIMKLTLKCHNLENGCEEKFSLENCEAHLKECIYEKISCRNRPCMEMVLRGDIQDHELRYCMYRRIRCLKCRLKVSPDVLEEHDCVKALRKRLKCAKKVIKTKNQEIKDCKKEIQTLKENSALSSSDSMDALDEVVVDFRRTYPDSVSDISLSSSTFDSFAEDIRFNSDSESGDESLWVPSTGDILLGLEQHLTQRNTFSREESQDLDDSIEVLRTSTPHYAPPFNSPSVPLDDLAASSSRRPPKRKVPILLSDSSSDEGSSDAPNAFQSPKRAWSHFYPRNQSDNLASLPETGAGPSSVATTSAATNGSHYNARPSLVKTSKENETSVTVGDTSVTKSGGVFDRTIALLSQYNFESDPEWLPEADNDSNSSLENPLPSRDGYITSSDESSLVESDSDGSVLPPPNALSLFDDVTLSSDDDPDDSSWINY